MSSENDSLKKGEKLENIAYHCGQALALVCSLYLCSIIIAVTVRLIMWIL